MIGSRSTSLEAQELLTDHPPPKCWEQFEELCADVFQSAFADPSLVRHGRAGQRQHGVDIVARHGSLYPVGLQCKKRSVWPVTKLSTGDIDADIIKATGFTPPLKQLYILTTAPDDAGLQSHIRTINETHERKGLFEVCLLGWTEIIRRAALDSAVMAKHFGPTGAQTPRSPLLATWFMSSGRLENSGDDLSLDVVELYQDLHDSPTGHFVVRQRESDALLTELRQYEGRELSTDERRARIALRKDLRARRDVEARAVQGVSAMLADPNLTASLTPFHWPIEKSHLAIEAFVNEQLNPETAHGPATYLRLSPPGRDYHEYGVVQKLTPKDAESITVIRAKRAKKLGRPLTETVAELPDRVLHLKAIPRIVRHLLDRIESDHLTFDELRKDDLLDIGGWGVSLD